MLHILCRMELEKVANTRLDSLVLVDVTITHLRTPNCCLNEDLQNVCTLVASQSGSTSDPGAFCDVI
jgi:hypothetical protein